MAQNSKKSIFLRHDIDRYTNRIEKFSKLEKKLGIKSTFYFRPPKNPSHIKLIRTVSESEHDIGYHYNDLAEHKGNLSLAMESFSETLAGFRSSTEVKSICMHGNALSSINNLDLWKNADFMEFGLTGDPYIVIDYNQTLYLTDTGRCWNRSRFSKWDKVQSPFNYHPTSTASIITDIEKETLPPRLYICIHPEHYYDQFLKWTAYALKQAVKNEVKALVIGDKTKNEGRRTKDEG
jgi:hypothetical protein